MKKNKGFSLVELLSVLVILAILLLLVSRLVVKNIDESKKEISESEEKAIVNAAEKWSVNNSDLFDDTEASKIQIGLDIVFVLDASNSMNGAMTGIGSRIDGLIAATNQTLDIFKENPDNRVAFVVFGGAYNASFTAITTDSIRVKTELTPIGNVNKLVARDTNHDGKADLYKNSAGLSNCFTFTVGGKTIEVTANNGATYTMAGVQTAATLMTKNTVEKGKRIPVYILITDGEPTAGRTLDEANPFKLGNVNIGNGRSACVSYSSWVDKSCKGFIVNYTKDSASIKNSEMVYNVMRVAYLAKQKASEVYGAEAHFYTIGIGSLAPYANFMLSPSTDINTLGTTSSTEPKSDINRNLRYYLEHKSVKDYKYNQTDEAFLNVADFDELRDSLQRIATRATEAAKVTEVCVSIDDLYNGGYLSTKDIKLPSGSATSEYVLMSYNEATKQYSFNLAKTEEQKKSCEKYYSGLKK